MIDGAVMFGEWLPDQSSLNNPGLTAAKNVIPVDGDYKPYQPVLGFGDALAERPRGGAVALDSSGAASTYVGSVTKLWVRDGTAWDDRSGATYTTAAEGYWRYTQFDTLIIATNYADVPQALEAGDPGNFANLALTGTAPRARQIGVIGRFVMLGDCNDGTYGVVPHSVWWCEIDDPTNWPTPNTSAAQLAQSGRQVLNAGHGAVTGIFGGDQFGIILQRSAVTRCPYVGGNLVFQFDTIDASRGARYPNASVQDGNLIYFIAADGFFVTDGEGVAPFGSTKFDRYFMETVDTAYIHRVYGALDKVRGLIYWIYPGPGNISGRPNRALVYNIDEKRMSRADDDVEILITALSSGVTLDGLDDYFDSLDEVSPSLDSASWQGGNETMLGFDTVYRAGSFAGVPTSAVIETQETELSPGKHTFFNGVKPLVAGSSAVTVALGTRDSLADAVTWSDPITPTTRTGVSDFRKEARYARARLTVNGSFEFTKGLQYDATETGAA